MVSTLRITTRSHMQLPQLGITNHTPWSRSTHLGRSRHTSRSHSISSSRSWSLLKRHTSRRSPPLSFWCHCGLVRFILIHLHQATFLPKDVRSWGKCQETYSDPRSSGHHRSYDLHYTLDIFRHHPLPISKLQHISTFVQSTYECTKESNT